MATLEALARRIARTEDLASIVRTMKTLSSVSIRPFEEAVAALAHYHRTVDLGLRAVLGRLESRPPAARAPEGAVAAIVFGSDHGLCGRFNDAVVTFALARLAEHAVPAERRLVLAVGARAAARLEALGHPVAATLALPSAATGLTRLAEAVLLTLDGWRAERGLAGAWLVHNRRTTESPAVPHLGPLLPVDFRRLQALARRRWPSRRLPIHSMDAGDLLRALVRELLIVSVVRAGAESLASEHASRLLAMQAAERSIDDHLAELHAEFRRRRQDSVTAELLDVVAGFETLRTREGHAWTTRSS